MCNLNGLLCCVFLTVSIFLGAILKTLRKRQQLHYIKPGYYLNDFELIFEPNSFSIAKFTNLITVPVKFKSFAGVNRKDTFFALQQQIY